MPGESLDFGAILRVLNEHGVDYILVGGLSQWLQGVPLMTADMDIVHDRSPENVEKLVRALRDLNAYYWEHINRRLEPESRTLLLPGHHLLKTDFGRIDVLGQIGDKRSFSDLIDHTEVLEIEPGVPVRLLDLPTVRDIKARLGRPKDLIALPIIDKTIEEIQRRQRESDSQEMEQP